jgi:hypothetical protein
MATTLGRPTKGMGEAFGGTKLVFSLPAGSKVLPVELLDSVPNAGGQREWLLPRDTQYRIRSIKTVDGRKVIHADILPRAANLSERGSWRARQFGFAEESPNFSRPSFRSGNTGRTIPA